MKYLTIIGLLILSSCHLDKKLLNMNDKTIKKNKTENVILSDLNFKKMSLDEFDAFLKEYSKNSDYPDINK